MQKKKKIIIFLIVLGIIFTVLGIICSNSKYGEKISYNTKEIKNCKKNAECTIPLIEYKYINIKIRDKKIKKLVSNINKTTNKLFKKSIDSDLKASECVTSKDKFKYRMIYDSIFNTFENSEFFSIAIKRTAIDVCNDKNNIENVEVYYYDKKNKKFLTQGDILKKISIKSMDIEIAIATNVFEVNKELNKDYEYYNTKNNGKLNFKLFFDYEGELHVYYKQNEDNLYFDVNLGRSIWKSKK